MLVSSADLREMLLPLLTAWEIAQTSHDILSGVFDDSQLANQLGKAGSIGCDSLKTALLTHLQGSGIHYARERDGHKQKAKISRSVTPHVNDVVLFTDSEKYKRFRRWNGFPAIESE